MSKCDAFVFLDDVEITKSGYTRRVRIRHQSNPDTYRWLTVPLQKHSDFALINELKIDQNQNWIDKHKNLLKQTYRKKAGWETHGKWLLDLYAKAKEFESLSNLNIFLIKSLAERLNFTCDFHLASELDVDGKADTYTYRIAKQLKAKTYIRGLGEQRYAKDPVWDDDKQILVENIEYEQFTAKDKVGTWIKGYSTIDLLMHQDHII